MRIIFNPTYLMHGLPDGHPLRRSRSLWVALLCALVALAVAFLPEYPGLNPAGRYTLAILILAAGLWLTEAIPAFAVALLVIGLEILILGVPGGVFAASDDPGRWRIFIAPWASPLIWLFLGGLILAEAAAKTSLDRTLARAALSWAGVSVPWVLLAVMLISFVLSMFMSNTATAAMMIAVIMPLVKSLSAQDRLRKALLLSVAFAANLGGMATIIGTPPNAIAAGTLAQSYSMDFLTWMVIGLPPAVLLLAITWLSLWQFYPSSSKTLPADLLTIPKRAQRAPGWQRWVTAAVFIATVGLWMAGDLDYSSPTAVIAFLPITVLCATGIIKRDDICNLPWDVLILITGGLALGVAVTETGLAQWLVQQLPLSDWHIVMIALAFGYLTALLSNFMSNTGAANILIPIGFASAQALGDSAAPPLVLVLIALSASAAMALPIATPPNALAYGRGELAARDFISVGLLIGLLTPLCTLLWCQIILPILGY